MKRLLLLVLLCCTTTVGAQELFSVKSDTFRMFDVDTELPQLTNYEGSVEISYYETDKESYMYVNFMGDTAMFKITEVQDDFEGRYLNFLMIAGHNEAEDTLFYLLLPKVKPEYFIVIIVQPNNKTAVQCQIRKSTT